MEEVERAIHSGDASRVVAAADRAIASGASDPRLLQCKVVALTINASFDVALQAAEQRPDLVYERAYCLFRLQRFAEALALLETGDTADTKSSFRELELRAQTLYRLERFGECMAVYDRLLAQKQDDYGVERRTNAMAAQAAAALAGQKVKAPAAPPTTATFEQSYNASCLDLAQGKYDAAIQRLEQAQTQCRQLMKEDPDVTEEELETELALLRVQQAVAHQLAGRQEEAAAIYNRVYKKRPDDASLVAVVSNNLVAINKEKDLFDSRKKMRNTSSAELDRRMASFQRRVIAMNQAVLLLLLNQPENCRQACTDLAKAYPDSELPTLILAASQIRSLGKKASVAEKLAAAKAVLGEGKLGQLVAAQILVDSKDLSKAAEVLEGVSEVRHQPAIVGYLVALYNKLKRSTDAERVLTASLQYWQGKAKTAEDLAVKAQLLRACGELELVDRNYPAAVTHFTELVADQPEDTRALASLIIALSHVDLKQAEEYAQTLPPSTPMGVEGFNVDELEQGKGIRTSKQKKGRINFAKLAATGSGEPADGATKKKKKKRKKKPLLPKNYVESQVPDPERWLPKWQRTGYASKHKKKQQQAAVGKGTQGSANISAAEAAALDAANRPTIVAPKKPPPGAGSGGKKKGKKR